MNSAAMRFKDWNPDQYLDFRRERTQPAYDLAERITLSMADPRIIDVGCGPGNSGEVLWQRWPDCRFLGVDNSPAMIAKAKATFPQRDWRLADASDLALEGPYDLIFSNAVFQWLPDHASLMSRLARLIAPGGTLAFQIPTYPTMLVYQLTTECAASPRWQDRLAGCHHQWHFQPADYYYDRLAAHYERLDIWETKYVHILPSHQAIVEFIRTTGLKPYLDCLHVDERQEFAADILGRVAKGYTPQADGKLLFPFHRLFVIAR